MRETSTGIGTLPLRKPGILTLSARSEAACSTAWCTSALGTSTVSRTLLSGSSSTWVGTEPLEQTATNLGAMRLFVIARHGESTLNLENRVNGDPGVPVALTDKGRDEARLLGQQVAAFVGESKGRDEARLLGQQVAHIPLDLCVHTQFSRTLETAE